MPDLPPPTQQQLDLLSETCAVVRCFGDAYARVQDLAQKYQFSPTAASLLAGVDLSGPDAGTMRDLDLSQVVAFLAGMAAADGVASANGHALLRSIYVLRERGK